MSTKKSMRLRPVVESLESLRLLATVLPVQPPQITLAGTLHLIGHSTAGPHAHGQISPSSFEATGSGVVGGLGAVKSVLVTTPGILPGYSLVLVGKHAQFDLQVESTLPIGKGGSATSLYDVAGSRGAIPHLSNFTGNITASVAPSVGGQSAITLKLV